MVRNTLSVIAGAAVALAVIFLVEGIMGLIYPPPPGTDLTNPESVKHLMDAVPHMVFIWLLIGFSGGSFAGGVIAAVASLKVNFWPPLIVGLIVMGYGLMEILETRLIARYACIH